MNTKQQKTLYQKRAEAVTPVTVLCKVVLPLRNTCNCLCKIYLESCGNVTVNGTFTEYGRSTIVCIIVIVVS